MKILKVYIKTMMIRLLPKLIGIDRRAQFQWWVRLVNVILLWWRGVLCVLVWKNWF